MISNILVVLLKPIDLTRKGYLVHTVFLGIATFGCPSCILPIAGTLGLIFTAQTLPFLGIEFQVLAVLILLATFAWLLYLMHKRGIQIPVPAQ